MELVNRCLVDAIHSLQCPLPVEAIINDDDDDDEDEDEAEDDDEDVEEGAATPV